MLISADHARSTIGGGVGPDRVEPDRPEAASALSSASKALALLEAMAGADHGLFGVTQLADMIGVPKSTAHRLLKALEERGFVERTGPRYRVGSLFFRLSEAAKWSQFGQLRRVAGRPLSWLFERTDAVAVHLAVLCGSDVLYLDKICRPAGTRLPSRIGGRFPATCTALGKAMLAHSDPAKVAEVLGRPLARVTPRSVTQPGHIAAQLVEIRRQGYAVENEEACHGMVCVAAPVLLGGSAIAAVSVSVPSVAAGTSEARIAAQGACAIEAAARVARILPEYSTGDDAAPVGRCVPAGGMSPSPSVAHR